MYDTSQAIYLWRLAQARMKGVQAAWAALRTRAAIREFQERVRVRFWEALGGAPEKCELEARSTGVIQAAGYRIEKVHFQSLPGFYVTCNLYVPDGLGTNKAPGVLVCMGHHAPAKAWPEYQVLCANLALRGMVVLGFDPLGQGERGAFYSYHYGDAKGNAHDAQGIQCQITDRPLAFYFVWDSIRALDYLVTRPEVDASRLGCTGSSGGGTQTTHLAALDERVKVAAPLCSAGAHLDILSTWMLHPEGNLPDMFDLVGASNENLSLCMAPRRLLLLGGSEDQLAMAGVHEVMTRLRPIYEVLGAGAALGFKGFMENHGCTGAMREAIYGAMVAGLGASGVDGGAGEVPTQVFTPQELQVTRGGHVEELGSRSVHQLNLARAEELVARRVGAPVRSAAVLRRALDQALFPGGRDGPSAARVAMDELVLHGMGTPVDLEGGGTLVQYHVAAADGPTALLWANVYEPAVKAWPGVLLYVRDTTYAYCGSLVASAIAHHHAAITVELPPTDSQRLLMLGMSPGGYCVAVLAWLAAQVAQRHGWAPPEWHIVAQGRLGGLVGMRLALEPQAHVGSLSLMQSYLTWVDSLRGPRQAYPELQVTPGLLREVDVPELLVGLAEVPVIVADPYDGEDKACSLEVIEAALAPIRAARDRSGRAAALRAISSGGEGPYTRLGAMIFS